MARAAALIEFYDGHDECLFSQHEFLRTAFDEVHVICSRALRERLPFRPAHGLGFEGPPHRGPALGAVARHLRAAGVSHAVINTASGRAVRNFVLRNLVGGPRFAGVLHNARKLGRSATQAIISARVRRYFVLNDYVRARLGPRVEAFYPVLFPAPPPRLDVAKPPGEFWVCVPGQVELKRRDYRALLDDPALSALPPRIRFVLLGPAFHPHGDGPALAAEIARRGLRERFVLFRDFVPYDAFHRWVSLSDLVLPLVHPDVSHADYARWQISGSFNLAFGFGIPMACHRSFEAAEDFRASSFFYPSREGIAALVARLADDPGALAAKAREIRGVEKLSFAVQSRRYLDHLLAG
jgi:hypothetical protein